jgi:hypothetical protein
MAGNLENAGRNGRQRTRGADKMDPARIVRANAIFRFVGEKNEAKELMCGGSWPQR